MNAMKDKNEIFKDLLKIVNENYQIETDFISIDTKLFDGGISLDSVQLIELTVAVEQFYGFEFSDDVLTEENFSDFEHLTNLVYIFLQKRC